MHPARLYAPDIPVRVEMHSRARVGLQVNGRHGYSGRPSTWPDQAHMSSDLTHEERFIDMHDDAHRKIGERIRPHG